MIDKKIKDVLESIYYDLNGRQGSFGSVRSLYQEAKLVIPKKITYKIVKKFLSGQNSYVEHRRVIRKIFRRPMLKLYPNDIWSMDTIFFNKNFKGVNKKKINVVTCVDTFSKYGWAKPVSNKSPLETVKAFKKILLEAKSVPRYIFVDKGTEFLSEFKKFVSSLKISIYTTESGIKSFPVENFNYVLKTSIYRQMSHFRSNSWILALERALKSYNKTKTPALNNISPEQALKNDNIVMLQEFYLNKRYNKLKSHLFSKPKFFLGQKVKKIIIEKWQRGFKPRFSKNVYNIVKIFNDAKPIRYQINDNSKTKYYFNELIPFLEDEKSDHYNKVLAILSSKKIPVKFLRSGKAIQFEKIFLTKIQGVEKPKYLKKIDVLKLKNGEYFLNKYSDGI